MDQYTESTTLRPLILGIAATLPLVGGIAAGVDTAILAHVEDDRRKRLDYLIQCLENGDVDLGGLCSIHMEDQVLHAAYATIEATLRTSRREKIRAYARLFKLGIIEHPRISLTSEHEDYLRILDDLSLRELQILYLLDQYEKTGLLPIEGYGRERTPDTIGYWKVFIEALTNQLGIPHDEVDGLLVRLARTGMYELGQFSTHGCTGMAEGRLTGAYRRLATLLGDNPGWFDVGNPVP